MILQVNSKSWTTTMPLARFEMGDDGIVHASYHSKKFGDEMENEGVTVKAGTFFPKDGASFMNAIGPAFSRSSSMEVLRIS